MNKKILIGLLIIGLILINGLMGVNDVKSEISEESVEQEIYYEIPRMVFSRYPTDNFIFYFYLLNKTEQEIILKDISITLKDGTKILYEEPENILKGVNLKISNDEIRDILGIIPPDEKNLIKAESLFSEASLMEKSDERTKKIEIAWYLLRYKENFKKNPESQKLLSYLKSFSYKINLKDLYKKIEPVDFMPVNINISIINQDNSEFTLSKEVNLIYLNSLSSQEGWYPGDGHMHTNYSDGFWNTIGMRRNQAYNSDLKWIIITDHGWNYLVNNWNNYKTECTNAQKVTPNITVCPGEEIATSDTDSHYLSYKMDNINTPLLDHTYDRYGTIYWVLNNGALGFVAHPYWTPSTWTDWHDYTGLRGIELISGNNVVDDTQLQEWDDYLRNNLSNTMRDSNHRFCVGLGNSDEHIGEIGYIMTYIYTGSSQPPGTYRPSVYNALERGRATASSDGSLLIHKITTGGSYLPGYYMQKSSSGYITVNVDAKRAISYCEWAEIQIITKNGIIVDDLIWNQYEINRNYSIWVNQDTYVRAQIIFYGNGYSYCFSNPIFIDFPPYGQ